MCLCVWACNCVCVCVCVCVCCWPSILVSDGEADNIFWRSARSESSLTFFFFFLPLLACGVCVCVCVCVCVWTLLGSDLRTVGGFFLCFHFLPALLQSLTRLLLYSLVPSFTFPPVDVFKVFYIAAFYYTLLFTMFLSLCSVLSLSSVLPLSHTPSILFFSFPVSLFPLSFSPSLSLSLSLSVSVSPPLLMGVTCWSNGRGSMCHSSNLTLSHVHTHMQGHTRWWITPGTVAELSYVGRSPHGYDGSKLECMCVKRWPLQIQHAARGGRALGRVPVRCGWDLAGMDFQRLLEDILKVIICDMAVRINVCFASHHQHLMWCNKGAGC